MVAAMVDSSELHQAKRQMRETATARRREIAANADASFAARALAHLDAEVGIESAMAISAFWPLAAEFDTRPLLDAFHRRGHLCLLPVVRQRDAPLLFRRWTPDAVLADGGFGVQTPLPSAPAARPDLLLVPLLAFDGDGFRLGYGGGYYDRTLAALRSDGEGPVLAVGLAFAGQEAPRVPRGGNDQRLDWIVTEAGARAIGQ